jgi:hypothetical protein
MNVPREGWALLNGTNPPQRFSCMGNRKTDFSNATMCHGRPTGTIQIKSRQLLSKPGRNQYLNLIKVE